ncbi:MAG: NAD(P)/FAD-dependent oxidoreductase [Parachlamydiales bacterium]|jgi:hypothetical protein
MSGHFDVIVVGGGAAGFFSALTIKETFPEKKLLLVEKSSHLLNKVRISGGGRCNVTHACFEPRPLTQNYPRGNKALIGPFHTFQPQDMIQWLGSRGVELKVESDGRMFPITDSSQTIIDCFLREAEKLGLEIRQKQSLHSVVKDGDNFVLEFPTYKLTCDKLILCTGSSPQGHLLAQNLGHSIQPPVPSLFTFNTPTSPLLDLAGIAVNPVEITILQTKYSQKGPLLITHWGFSGPAALKLSAWSARHLHECNYNAHISIDWLPEIKADVIKNQLLQLRNNNPNQYLANHPQYNIPKNLWKRLIDLSKIDSKKRLAELNNQAFESLISNLKQSIHKVEGKTTYKEEFVTCGGITLDEVNFKTMESRICKNLFFAGEVLDIDAVTGGFNFQNAWTTAFIAGKYLE